MKLKVFKVNYKTNVIVSTHDLTTIFGNISSAENQVAKEIISFINENLPKTKQFVLTEEMGPDENGKIVIK